MRNFQSMSHSARQKRARAVASSGDQHRMTRGLVNGLILSLAIWLAAGYLTVILH